MNYNDYDSNGNKKKFDFSKVVTDKQSKSRMILFFYLVLIVGLILMIRVSPKNTDKKNESEEKNNNQVVEENNALKELDEMFSFIDGNNYEFKYTMTFKDNVSIMEGKRYSKKISFKLIENDEYQDDYIGTEDNLSGVNNNISSNASFNMFTTTFFKKVITNSTVNNGIYEITNENLNKIMSNNVEINDKEKNNTLELVMKNNKITEIHFDISSLISDYSKENTKALVVLEYYNFGLVDDFAIKKTDSEQNN